MAPRRSATLSIDRTDIGSWRVTTIEAAHGLAKVRTRGHVTEVFIAEVHSVHDYATSPEDYTSTTCTPDGGALVVADGAPPAIIISGEGHRTSPAQPGADHLEQLVPGDRILILSSASFDALPKQLADLLRDPATLLSTCATTLLQDLFDEIGEGAGAVIEFRDHDLPLAG